MAPQSYATLASTAGTRLAALLSLRYRYVWCSLRACQLVFSSKRSLSRHPRLLLPPNLSRSRYAPYYFVGVNRRLLLGSPAGREGVVLSQFLLCYVTFLLLPPSIHRCGSIRFFRTSFRSAATYLQPKGELAFHSFITFRTFRYTPLSFTTFIRSDKPSSDPAKETTLHAKTPPALLRLPSCSLRYATLRTPCQPPSLHSQRLRLTLRRQGKHSAIATLLSHRLVAQGCFPCAGE